MPCPGGGSHRYRQWYGRRRAREEETELGDAHDGRSSEHEAIEGGWPAVRRRHGSNLVVEAVLVSRSGWTLFSRLFSFVGRGFGVGESASSELSFGGELFEAAAAVVETRTATANGGTLQCRKREIIIIN